MGATECTPLSLCQTFSQDLLPTLSSLSSGACSVFMRPSSAARPYSPPTPRSDSTCQHVRTSQLRRQHQDDGKPVPKLNLVEDLTTAWSAYRLPTATLAMMDTKTCSLKFRGPGLRENSRVREYIMWYHCMDLAYGPYVPVSHWLVEQVYGSRQHSRCFEIREGACENVRYRKSSMNERNRLTEL